MIRATGWDPFESSDWPEVVELLTERGGEWPLWAVRHDLRWWASVERLGLGVRPGRPALVKRYRWGDRRLRDYIAGGAWEDPRYVQPTSSEGPAKVQRTSSRRPDTTTSNVNNGAEMSSECPADVQPTSSEGPADVPTRVGSQTQSQITDTENTGSPAEPTSRHPDGPTDPSGTLPLPVVTPAIPAGPADGGREGNTREPSVARNASAPGRAKRPSRAASETVPEDVLGALAEIDAKAARRVAAGKSEGTRSALVALVKAIGDERTIRRLRFVARFPADSGVRWWRDHGASLSAVLRAGTPLASGFDVSAEAVEGAAAARLEAPTVGDWRADGWRPDTLAAKATPVTQDPAWVAWRDIAEPYIRESRRTRKPPAGPVPPEVERVVDRIGGWTAVNNIAEIADVGAALRAALKEVA